MVVIQCTEDWNKVSSLLHSDFDRIEGKTLRIFSIFSKISGGTLGKRKTQIASQVLNDLSMDTHIKYFNDRHIIK